MKNIIKYIAITALLVVLIAFPVSAEDTNGNEIIDMHKYATYTFPEGDSEVYVDCYFPSEWIRTEVYQMDFSGAPYAVKYGSPITFDTDHYGLNLQIQPVGSSFASGNQVGAQAINSHIIDLSVVPKHTWFHSSFLVYALAEGEDDPDAMPFHGYQILYFVDSDGVVVYRHNLYMPPSRGVSDDGYISFWFGGITDLNSIPIPDTAVGVIPVYQLYNDGFSGNRYQVHKVEFSKFRFSYNLSALQYESQQNERLLNTMENVQNALEEQNKKLDSIINSEVKPENPPTPTTPDGDAITDALDKQEEQLQGSAQEGLEQGKQTLNQALEVLVGYMDAFHVVGVIFREFAELPFFASLLILSLALGLVATLLGMALEFKSFSVAEEKRKTAAENRARRDYDRAEYRRRMLERSK